MVQFTGLVAVVLFACNVFQVYGLPVQGSGYPMQQPMFNQFSQPFRAPMPAMQPAFVPPMTFAPAPTAPPAVPYAMPATSAPFVAPAAAASYGPTTAAYAYETETNATDAVNITADVTQKPDCYYSQGAPSTPSTIFRWPTQPQSAFGFPVNAGPNFMQRVPSMQPVQSFQPMQTLQPVQTLQPMQPTLQPTFHSFGLPMTSASFGANPMASQQFAAPAPMTGFSFGENRNPAFPTSNMGFNGFANNMNNNPALLNNNGIFNRVN